MAGHWFSPSYAEAARRFSDACEKIRGNGHAIRHERLELGLTGPDDEILAIDVAVIGSLESGKAVLSSSGIHGVEGYSGSAIQLAIMDDLVAKDSFTDYAVIFIHSVNPFGMAWWRRFNESNVDLNRNFLRLDEKYEGVPEGYHFVKKLINPEKPPSKMEPFFALRALWLIIRHGFNNLKQWVAEGQYEFPEAIQFGGKELEKGPVLIIDWLKKTLVPIKQLWAIDLHTGLGPSGHDTLLVPADLGEEKTAKLIELFPGHVEHLDSEKGVGYEIMGDIHQGLVSRFGDIDWTYVTQEFGTFKPVRVLKASRDENRWTQWGKYSSEKEAKSHWSRLRMLRTFNPDDGVWQERVVNRGKIVFETAVDDLLSAEGRI